MSSRSWVVQCLTVVVAMTMTSCSDTTIAPNSQAGSLRLSIIPAALTLQEGETHPVQAVVTDRNRVAIPSLSSSVQWSSSAGDTVQVSGDIAHALLPGHAHVYAVLNAEGVSLSDSISVTVTPVAASIQVVQGDAQRAPVNSTLATPLEVRVLDRHGAPVPGYMVRFVPSPSDGQVSPDSAATNANGDAQTEWTLPSTPGSYTVSVDAGSLQGSPASFTATALILQPASALHIQPDSVVLPAIQDTVHLNASVYGADGQLINGWEPTWTSMDPSVASVDGHGVVQALGAGRVGVIAAVPGAADTTTIVVRQAVGYLQITGARELPSVGDTLQLGILLLDPNGFPITSGETVRWTSSALSVATVDSNGLVTATGYGSTQITASASFLTSRVLIPVSPTVAQVNVTPGFYALSVGDTARLTANAVDANDHAISGATYVWSSSDSAVAWVSQTGLVTAIANGSATIRAASDSTDGEAAINVGGSTATVSRITISPASGALHAIGDTIRLAATALDSAGGTINAPSVVWSSLDPSIASVNGAGRVRSLATGRARIRASDGTAADTAIVTIDQVPATVSVSPASLSLALGDSARLSASVLDAMGVAIPGASVSWSASNTVINVSSSGIVHAVSAGTATVTATSGSVSGSASVAVTGTQTTVRRVVTTPSTMSLNALGDTATIQAVAYDSSGNAVTGAAVAWRSLNPGVVTVDASGRITASAVGLAFIVASSVCCTAADTTSVAVSQAAVSVSVTPASFGLSVGDTAQLRAVVTDANGNPISGANVLWSSSDTSVARVGTTGVVRAVGPGSATVKAQLSSGSASGEANVAVSAQQTTAPVPPPTGSANLVFDTRAGGAQSIQSANVSSLTDANAADGGGTRSRNAAGYSVYPLDFVLNYDGLGTKAYRFNWTYHGGYTGTATCYNGNGEQDASVAFNRSVATPVPLYIQWKTWFGRTQTGGGMGSSTVGSFNNGGGHKLLIVYRYKNGSTGYRVYFGYNGGNGMAADIEPPSPYPYTAWTEHKLGVTPHNLNNYINTVVTFTLYLQPESSPGAYDGRYEAWINGEKLWDKTGLPMGNVGYYAQQFGGPTWICPPQDQTQYMWDFVEWTK